MQLKFLTAAVAAAGLAACGGGGGGSDGGGGGAATAPVAVQITSANAKPVGAHASGTVQDSTAVQTATSVVGVQVASAPAAAMPQPERVARVALAMLRHAGSPAIAAGVVVDEAAACDNGGTVRISGNVASDNGLNPGDAVTLSASSCASSVNGQPVVMSGQLTLAVTSGFLPQSGVGPFDVKLTITASNLSVSMGGTSTVTSGDMALDWAEATGSRLVVSGTTLSNSTTIAGSTRVTTLRNYLHSVEVVGTGFIGSLAATVETSGSRLGSGAVSYAISTPTSLRWSASDAAPTAGVVQVVGAGNSQLRLTFSGASASLDVDADGNGSFESSMPTDAAELKSLL